MAAHNDFRDDAMIDTPMTDRPLSRRRLFELGGATAALAALLAACGKDSEDPGRVGLAPTPTELLEEPVGDVVYLRTLMSLEYSILDIYGRFQADGGLTDASVAALDQFVADHTAAAEQLATLIPPPGEPFACPNPWYGERFFGPALDNVFGNADATPQPIPSSDDVARDVRSLIYALESLASASTFQFVGRLTTPELRAATVSIGSQAARRAATVALLIHPGPAGYVTPDLLDASEAEAIATTTVAAAPADTSVDGTSPAPAPALPPTYAVTSRFAQLTAINVEVGAPNDLNQRFKTAFETPADNAYAYSGLSCPA